MFQEIHFTYTLTGQIPGQQSIMQLNLLMQNGMSVARYFSYVGGVIISLHQKPTNTFT